MRNVQINNNGNTRESLMEELRDAANAVREARDKIGQLTIHGRNYQTVDDPTAAFRADIADKVLAVEKLNAVDDYLRACFDHLLETIEY